MTVRFRPEGTNRIKMPVDFLVLDEQLTPPAGFECFVCKKTITDDDRSGGMGPPPRQWFQVACVANKTIRVGGMLIAIGEET